jgi:hypothetical protein
MVALNRQFLACNFQNTITDMLARLSAKMKGAATVDNDANFDDELDSWVEIASQPSSSSLSSVGEEVQNAGPRQHQDSRGRRRRTLRPNAPVLNSPALRRSMSTDTSSQEEYDESESESDRVMNSSEEGPIPNFTPASAGATFHSSDDDDENRTAINHPLNNDQCFTPQPNAFSHPPSGQMRAMSQPSPGSYFPTQRRESQSSVRTSLPPRRDGGRTGHMPQNILSPSYDAAAQNDEALRTSLSTLLSCAAAARGLSKPESKRAATATTQQRPRSNRVEPMSLRLIPESALPENSPTQFQEPTFKPTIRRVSTSTSASSEQKENKRKAVSGRSSSRERRALKKARRTTSNEDLHVSPTLLTWVVSAGVVVVLSALSFSAGYSMGKEAGRIEAGGLMSDEQIRSCAREAGRSSLGLKRSLARSAVQV